MRLTIVGCSGSFPGPVSPASCYLIEHDGYRVLLDMGNGSLGALARYIDIYDVNAVAISHLHIDHCADLASYYVARKYCRSGPLPPIPVFGPVGVAERLSAMYGPDRGVAMTDIFDFHAYGAEAMNAGPFTITSHRVRHCVPAYALRAEAGGRSIVYSGDTGPCDELIDASRGADIALYDASYLSRETNPTDLHMTGSDGARIAMAAGVGRLILTHLVPWNDSAEVLAEAAALYNRDVRLASPGMVEEI